MRLLCENDFLIVFKVDIYKASSTMKKDMKNY